VDAMLDLAVADDLKTSFYVEPVNNSLELLAELVRYPYSLYGVSDGGAHTKFLTAGRYPTEMICRFVRDNDIVSLEEMHYRLSALPAHCAGLTDRGTLTRGNAADIIIYNLDELNVEPGEIVHDLPGDEWRRVQRATGYRHVLINGQVTFIDGEPTEARPGELLRNR
jgi:N-acyl-D-aspartate/D-glutamate deacylase